MLETYQSVDEVKTNGYTKVTVDLPAWYVSLFIEQDDKSKHYFQPENVNDRKVNFDLLAKKKKETGRTMSAVLQHPQAEESVELGQPMSVAFYEIKDVKKPRPKNDRINLEDHSRKLVSMYNINYDGSALDVEYTYIQKRAFPVSKRCFNRLANFLGRKKIEGSAGEAAALSDIVRLLKSLKIPSEGMGTLALFKSFLRKNQILYHITDDDNTPLLVHLRKFGNMMRDLTGFRVLVTEGQHRCCVIRNMVTGIAEFNNKKKLEYLSNLDLTTQENDLTHVEHRKRWLCWRTSTFNVMNGNHVTVLDTEFPLVCDRYHEHSIAVTNSLSDVNFYTFFDFAKDCIDHFRRNHQVIEADFTTYWSRDVKVISLQRNSDAIYDSVLHTLRTKKSALQCSAWKELEFDILTDYAKQINQDEGKLEVLMTTLSKLPECEKKPLTAQKIPVIYRLLKLAVQWTDGLNMSAYLSSLHSMVDSPNWRGHDQYNYSDENFTGYAINTYRNIAWFNHFIVEPVKELGTNMLNRFEREWKLNIKKNVGKSHAFKYRYKWALHAVAQADIFKVLVQFGLDPTMTCDRKVFKSSPLYCYLR